MTNTTSLSLSLDVSPLAFVRLMFQQTEANGILRLNDWYDVEKDDAVSCKNYSCKLNWTQDDLDHLIQEYTTLRENIDSIAPHWDALERAALTPTEPYVDSTGNRLSQSAECTYSIYIAPLSDRWPAREQATCRVGEGPFGLELISHARRLCHLMALQAPIIVCENEARMLIAALALNLYGTDVTEIA